MAEDLELSGGEETPPVDNPPADDVPPTELPSDLPADHDPELIMGKYKTQDDLISATKELQKSLQTSQAELKLLKDGKPPVDKKDPLADNTVKINVLSDELIKSGMVITPEIELQAKESKVDLRDIKIKAMETKQAVDSIYGMVGGKENFDEMREWANGALTKEEQNGFNMALRQGNNFVVKMLHERFSNAKEDGTAEVTIQATRSKNAPQGKTVYASMEQYLSDTKNPNYRKDPAFRKAVIEKKNRSKF